MIFGWLLLRWLLVTFNINKTSSGETFWATFPCHRHFTLASVKVSTSSELYPGYFVWYMFFDWPGIQFFDSPLTQPVRLHLATCHLLCSTSVTYRMPCHASGHQVLPAQPLPREAEDFLGVAAILRMCFCSHT